MPSMSQNHRPPHAPFTHAVAISAVLLSGCTQIAGESFEGYSLRPDVVPEAAGAADAGMSGAAGAAASTDGAVGAVAAEERRLVSGGIERRFLLVHPEPMPTDARLPLILSFHGERETLENSAETIREALPLEREAAGAAVFVYPRAPNSAPGWPFFNDAGRRIETEFIRAVIGAVEEELGIDPMRVFLAGWDGGAAMANALACRLGTNVLRGVAAHSGALYEVPREDGMGDDFEIDRPTDVTSCPLPDALVIWGTSDQSDGTTYAGDGLKTYKWYGGTLGCQPSQEPWSSVPECVSNSACLRSVVWCPIEGLGHSLWPGAAAAIWQFFDGLR